MRRSLALPLILTLAALAPGGCGRGGDEAFFDTRTPPQVGPRFWAPEGWAWGALQVKGAPMVRYGVAAPSAPPRAQVVILPGYGESAEVYFETVRDLVGRGYVVWVLEAAGQGGSGRFGPGRDVGRSRGFDKDAAALRALVREVVRPDGMKPVVIAAHGAGALPALLAAEGGLGRVDGLVLWSPDAPASAGPKPLSARIGLGGLRASGAKGWSRPDVDLSGRATLPAAWQLANPDLRMGGPSTGWLVARDQAGVAARAGVAKLRLPALTLAVQGDQTSASLCRSLPACRFETLPASPSEAHLSPDAVRSIWLKQVTGFVESRIAASDHGM